MDEDTSLSHLKVLVVDDKAAMRTIVQAVLRSLGISEIEVAGNGAEALNKLQGALDETPFTLVVSDWIMPEMNGVELLHAVRKHKQLSAIPFLMLTSENDKSSVLAAMSLGVTDYITKPFSTRVLEQKIRSFFLKSQSAL